MLRPRIKDVHCPVVLPGNRIRLGLGQYGIAAEIEDENGAIERILVLMDGTRDRAGIRAGVAETHPDIEADSVDEAVDDLITAGFAEDAAAPLPATLTALEAARYTAPRHFYAWLDDTPRTSPYEVQARLKSASVALLGLGGTGSAVAQGLVASGVGALHCADFDVVEEPNLCRQLLYTEHDIGAPKLKQALERLRAMNSFVDVTGEERHARGPADIAALMTGRDVFVLCADTPQPDIMRWANEAALATGTPWYTALYTGPMAVVAGYLPGETGCWECGRRDFEAQEHVRDGRKLNSGQRPHAVVPASANVTGQLCALEVVYHLGGLPTQVRGRVLHWNLGRWDHQYFIDVARYPDCPACGTP
ncbi:MAG TPA: ThiF family adenylyltransferase [Actinophytocola sp.]|uniref:HesA/MoeB/ThiF family protein n=1 Tax=Actinophytocola sp. TaxID=1872138 RepID=UPI002DB5F87C|nr:ThiF family adenylyltransferase [Actinophytocola sp.]HEU5474655.1 ThiF family adenylyltransferase [Actinophytocola sp.]